MFKIKLDENNKPVLVNENIVLVDEENNDIPVDVVGLYTKVGDLNNEAAKYRKQRNEERKRFESIQEVFGEDFDWETLDKWKKDADKAFETVQNFKDKELVDAGKVEKIKAETIAAKDEEIDRLKTSFNKSIKDLQDKLTDKDQNIYQLMVSSNFRQSQYFVGNDSKPPRTILPPEIAETYFGKQFKVEEVNGSLQTVGYDSKGNQIYSRKNPGELADFEEALGRIIDEYPQKDMILRGGSGGSGGDGGGEPRYKGGVAGQIQKMEKAYNEAIKNNQPQAAIVIKRQLHTLRQQQAAA